MPDVEQMTTELWSFCVDFAVKYHKDRGEALAPAYLKDYDELKGKIKNYLNSEEA